MTTSSTGFSTCPLTGNRFDLPSSTTDRNAIDEFLQNNEGKPVVVVQGLGFVGSVMSLVVANALTEEYAVIGIDIPNEASYWKIASINSGSFPVEAEDPKIEAFYQKAKEKGNLLATFDPYAYSKADVIVVDINLDVTKEVSETNELIGYDVDLSAFRKAVKSIGENCKPDCLVLVETTVPPGTCQKVVAPILKEELTQRDLPTDSIRIGHSYERVMPGPNYIDSIQNFYRVFSGIDEASKVATSRFLKTVISTDEYPLTELGNTSATEMAKVLENSFRAMNIAFIVEWSRFAEEAGVNLYEVVQAIRMRPTHKNIMLPGIGVGGYCLTKDPLLASWAKQSLFDSSEGLEKSVSGVATNDQMPKYAFDFLKQIAHNGLGGQKALLLGVSYLNDVGDTRYSPVELFFRLLLSEGVEVDLHDPYVRNWQEVDRLVCQSLDEISNNIYDIVAITTGHTMYRSSVDFIRSVCHEDSIVFDTIGLLTQDDIQQLSQSVNVKVLGRGDL